jgi:hypothetical protein
VPVHVTVWLVAGPEIVQTGVPPFLKCGLPATAADAVSASAPTTSRVRIVERRTVVLLFVGRTHPEGVFPMDGDTRGSKSLIGPLPVVPLLTGPSATATTHLLRRPRAPIR